MKVFPCWKLSFVVILFFLNPLVGAETPKWNPEKIILKSRDGHKLVGTYQPAQGENPTIIMLHGLRSHKGEWNLLAELLVKNFIGVLAYDARGHGESSKSKDKKGNANGYLKFGPPRPGSSWEKMINDVGLFLKYLEKKNLREIMRLEQRLAEWGLTVLDRDSAVAADIAQLWADVSLEALDEAVSHSWRALGLMQGPFDVQCESVEGSNNGGS